jgi:hypothetical protein
MHPAHSQPSNSRHTGEGSLGMCRPVTATTSDLVKHAFGSGVNTARTAAAACKRANVAGPKERSYSDSTAVATVGM